MHQSGGNSPGRGAFALESRRIAIKQPTVEMLHGGYPMFAHFQGYAEHLKPTLDAAFSKHLAKLLEDTRPIGSWGESQLLRGGKKIRGSLLCLVATTLGGTLEDALPRAIAVELIQTATLIHDDYVDQHRT